MIAIFHLQRGMPSKRKSSACIDYVPALCTHRPSLLPIEWSDENYGLSVWAAFVAYASREVVWTLSFRGRRSRNKVSVGEPAEGSLTSNHFASGDLFCVSKTTLRTCWLSREMRSGFGLCFRSLYGLTFCLESEIFGFWIRDLVVLIFLLLINWIWLWLTELLHWVERLSGKY